MSEIKRVVSAESARVFLVERSSSVGFSSSEQTMSRVERISRTDQNGVNPVAASDEEGFGGSTTTSGPRRHEGMRPRTESGETAEGYLWTIDLETKEKREFGLYQGLSGQVIKTGRVLVLSQACASPAYDSTMDQSRRKVFYMCFCFLLFFFFFLSLVLSSFAIYPNLRVSPFCALGFLFVCFLLFVLFCLALFFCFVVCCLFYFVFYLVSSHIFVCLLYVHIHVIMLTN